METNVIVVGAVGLVLAFIIFKFIAKNIIKVIAMLVVLAGIALYVFLVFGNPDKDIKFAEVLTEYTIDDLHNAYCTNSDNRSDSLKCVCIIQPLYDDIHTRFTDAEITEMRHKRIKFAAQLVKAYQNKKDYIKQKLKENRAEHLLDEFKSDITNRKFLKH